TSFDTHECGDHSQTEVASNFEHRAGIDQRFDYFADVVNAQTIFGDDLAQQALIGALPVANCALKIRDVPLCDLDCFGLVGRRNVDDSVRNLDIDRPYFLRSENSESAPLDHRWPTLPDIGVAGRDHHVAASEQRGVACETSSGVDSDQRHQPAQLAPVVEGHAVEARHANTIGVSRASTAAFGEKHDGQLRLVRDFEHPILLTMVLLTLGSGQDRVVIRHQDALSLGAFEQITVNSPDASDHAVGRRVLDQVLNGAPSTLSGDDDWTVLDEGAWIAEVFDILARGSLSGLSSSRDGFGAGIVEADRVAVERFRQIRADAIQIDSFGFRRFRSLHFGLFDEGQRMPFEDRVSDVDRDLAHQPADLRLDDVLHLHRFHHEELPALVHQ